MDSSRTEVCSGDVPCFEGSWAVRTSFSTCKCVSRDSVCTEHKVTYRNLKIHIFLSKSAHIVVEAEGIVANQVGCKDEVSLAFFLAIKNDFASRPFHNVVDIERAPRLDLRRQNVSSKQRQ